MTNFVDCYFVNLVSILKNTQIENFQHHKVYLDKFIVFVYISLQY